MSDFYSVLKQSLIDRDLRSAAEREDAYNQARRALVERLLSSEPALTDDELDARIGRFDKAVRRIEDDLSKIFDDDGPVAPKFGSAPDPAAELSAGRHTPPLDPDATHRRPGLTSGDGLGGKRRQPAGSADADEAEAGDADDSDRDLPPWLDRVDDDGDESDVAADGERDGEDPAVGGVPIRRPRLPVSEQQKVRWLIGVVAALGFALLAVIAYALLPAAPSDDDSPAEDASPTERIVEDAADATRVPVDPLKVEHTFTLFSGSDPTVFASDPDNPIRYDGGASGGGTVRISSTTGSSGARAIVGPGLSARLAGRSIRVLITARTSPELGAAAFRFAYQSGVAISHWQAAKLTTDYATFGLVWRVPSLTTDPSGNWIIIEPGIPGDGTGVDIRSIKIDLIASDPTATN